MRHYFGYLCKCAFTKAGIWISAGIFWLYTAVMLLLVPAITHIGPLMLWSNNVVILQAMYLIILSVFAALMVTYAFRIHIENETELIVCSKPIKRYKTLTCKMLVTLLGGGIVCLASTIIVCFTLCFGKYNIETNPSGMKFDKLGALIGSFWLATIVILLLFDSIGVLLSTVLSHIQLTLTLVCSSIVLEVYAMILQTVTPSVGDKVINKVGDNTLYTFRVISGDGNQADNYAFLNTSPSEDLYKIYQECDGTSNYVEQYSNIGYQLYNLYDSFEVNDISTSLQQEGFGDNAHYHPIIKSPEDNLLFNIEHNLQTMTSITSVDDFDSLYLLLPYYDAFKTHDHSTYTQAYLDDDPESGFMSYGTRPADGSSLAFFDGKPNDVYYNSVDGHYFIRYPKTWMTPKELKISGQKLQHEFTQDVFTQLFIPLLQGDISTYWIPYNSGTYGDEKTQLIFDNWLNNYLWPFISNNQQKYELNISNEQNLNRTVGLVDFTLLKLFVGVFWTQIVPDYLIAANISLDDFLCNGETSDSYYLDNVTYFNEILLQPITQIINPDTQTSYPLTNNLTVVNFIQYGYAYSASTWLNPDTHQYNHEHAWSDLNQFAVEYKDDGTVAYDWEDVTKAITERRYSALFGLVNTTSNGFGVYGPSQFYRYENEPYISNTTAAIFWSLCSILLCGISFVVYHRLDIK